MLTPSEIIVPVDESPVGRPFSVIHSPCHPRSNQLPRDMVYVVYEVPLIWSLYWLLTFRHQRRPLTGLLTICELCRGRSVYVWWGGAMCFTMGPTGKCVLYFSHSTPVWGIQVFPGFPYLGPSSRHTSGLGYQFHQVCSLLT